MADTGAPWNLPYPIDTDLVIDGASDIQDLAEAVDTALDTLEVEFVTAASDTVAIDFSTNQIITRTATGNITFTGSGYAEGKSATVRIVAGASSRTLTFPSNWVWVSLKPTSLSASATGILTVTSFGTADTAAVAAWAWSA